MAMFSEEWAIVATIDPEAQGAATVLSDAVDMSKYSELVAIVQVGEMTASSTVDFKFTQATTAAGVYKDVTSASITQLTQAGTDSDKQVVLQILPTALDMDSDYRYVKGSLTVAAAASDSAVVLLGRAKSAPASDNDLASVDEIVTVF